MGVSPARYGPNEGPFAALFGDRQEFMANLQVTLAVDKNGVFQGGYHTTYKDGNIITTYMSIANWNKQFENTNTSKPHQ